MPKTEDMIHKQALDSAWSLMKFYGSYAPHGHQAHADNLRRDLEHLDDQIDQPVVTEYERKVRSNLRDERANMLSATSGNPDLYDRRKRRPGDSEVMAPRPEHYERGALDPSHPNYDRKQGYALPDKNSEMRVSTKDTVKNPEHAEGESSIRTEGTGESPMEGIPEWLVNPGQRADEIHPMFYDRFADKGMELERPQPQGQLPPPRNRQLTYSGE